MSRTHKIEDYRNFGMMAKARKYPTNYILLSIFTVCWGYFLAVICVFKSAQVVGLAVAITVALTGLLMLFACQTKYARRRFRDSAFIQPQLHIFLQRAGFSLPRIVVD